jgi:hypothetical protein
VSDDNKHQSPAELNADAYRRAIERLQRGYSRQMYDVPPKLTRTDPSIVYDDSEQDILMHVFCEMLWMATRDGGKNRAAGLKRPWWCDETHMAGVWSHFKKHAQGQLVDENSGAHPYVHAAWRLLAIAYQETYGKVDPA